MSIHRGVVDYIILYQDVTKYCKPAIAGFKLSLISQTSIEEIRKNYSISWLIGRNEMGNLIPDHIEECASDSNKITVK